MKNDISKSICKALIFTVLPFAIPLIFEIIPNTFITNARSEEQRLNSSHNVISRMPSSA